MDRTVTLLEYAALRGVDPGGLAAWARDHPLPEPVEARGGQPAYRLEEIDAARGGVVVLVDFAAEHGLDVRQVQERWPRWHPDRFPGAVGEVRRGRSRAKVYPRVPLEEIRRIIAGAETVAEFAARIGVAADTVRKSWWIRHRGFRPAVVGMRAGASLYRPQELERLRRVAQGLPVEAVGSPGDWLTWEQLLSYFAEAAERAPGAGRRAMEERRAQGVWPPGVVGADGVERWQRGQAECLQAELTARRGRRRAGSSRGWVTTPPPSD